jgi:hypothetical protein
MANTSFTCPDCGMTSHNPNDVEHSYCGNCHEFKNDLDPQRILAVIVIYRNPSDFPGKYVVRRQWAGRGGVLIEPGTLAVVDTLDQARAAVPPEQDTRLNRQPDDDPCIVEVWL